MEFISDTIMTSGWGKDMLTNKQIETLIKCPKTITEAEPQKGMVSDPRNVHTKRKNMKLIAQGGQDEFLVFIRQNMMLTEQFSIGLRYKTENVEIGAITLIRYNGEHGTLDWSKDQHYGSFHIYRINSTLLEQEIYEPKEIKRTNSYSTFEQALALFLQKASIVNASQFLSSDNKQLEMFSKQGKIKT